MEATTWNYEIQWIGILLRWFHVVIGAMWIGTSFYLISWENKFNRTKGLRAGTEGNFWTIQGGDFYYIEKLKGAPTQLPEELHWFKYEAYLTWLSGFSLLCLVFYFDAQAMLFDRQLTKRSEMQAVLFGLGSLPVSWLIYNAYCSTRIARNLRISTIFGLLSLALIAYLFGQFFNQRAAIIHVGAVMGTIMAGNVFFVIIPWHKALTTAIKNREPLTELYRSQPGFRSRHNHYMTLPVFFIMLSGHFPAAFMQVHSWVVITAIALAGGLIKHYHNLVQRRISGLPYLLAAIALIFGIVYASRPTELFGTGCSQPVSSAQVFAVIETHCRSCHSADPTEAGWQNAPNGVMFDGPGQLAAMKDRIYQRAVVQQDMPLGVHSDMQQQERRLISCWANQAG